MHKLSLICILFLLSCGLAAVNKEKATDLAEKEMNDLKNENYVNLDNYFTDASNESEPLEKKIEKFKKLKEMLGGIESYALISATTDDNADNGGPKMELKYRLKCEKATVIHTLIIINDEGTHKITFENFEN